MIAAPMNDHACLGPTTNQIVAEVAADNPAIVELAAQFSNTDDLAAWFRTLPQRDDDGDPADGPKVTACRPPQRLQLDNPTPNCFERSARFVGAAELIEPERVYRLATVSTPSGLHTFPTRDGEPVILDPKGVRNTPVRCPSSSNEDATRNADDLGAPVMLTPTQAIDWIAELAMVRADRVIGGPRRIENGHRAMRGVLVLRPICIADVRDVALVLALAEREARRHGIGGLKIVHSTARAIDALDQVAVERATAPTRNNPFASIALGALANNKELQQLVGGLARVAGRIAGGIGLEAAKVKLSSVGVSAPVISAFERELNREGLTLGPLAKPAPMIGSLDAMTPQALAGRWLAHKIKL